MSDWKEPITPKLTTDALIVINGKIVLVKRKYPPLGWALPGGFVEVGERVENACIREAEEETGLKITDLQLLGVYSDPKRDPRFHTVSVVFVAFANGEPQGADDAEVAEAFPIGTLPNDIVFDHNFIIQDYIQKYLR